MDFSKEEHGAEKELATSNRRRFRRQRKTNLIRLESTVKKAVQRFAKQKQVTMSQCLEQIVRGWFKHYRIPINESKRKSKVTH